MGLTGPTVCMAHHYLGRVRFEWPTLIHLYVLVYRVEVGWVGAAHPTVLTLPNRG